MQLSKKAFDKQYATQWRKEVAFLKARGISPSFVREDSATGVRTYKYTKTKELFEALVIFYADSAKAVKRDGDTPD